MNVTMTTSESRKCNDPAGYFFYICRNFTLKYLGRNLNNNKKMYLSYFKVNPRNKEESWASHSVKSMLQLQGQGKNSKLKFGVPMVWREPTDNQIIATSALSMWKVLIRETNIYSNLLKCVPYNQLHIVMKYLYLYLLDT